MKRIFIRDMFKKLNFGRYRLIIIFVIIFILAGIIYWGYPLLLPNSSLKSPTTPTTVTTPIPTTVTSKSEVETAVKEKTEFEIEMEEREKGYKNKIFVYEAYEPPSNRNPFQKVRTPSFLAETVKEEEGSVLKFPKPELPPGTKLSGIIDSKNNRVAIIEINMETYIANLYDIISERYIIKEIKMDEVIIDFNGNLFSLKIGGEGTLND